MSPGQEHVLVRGAGLLLAPPPGIWEISVLSPIPLPPNQCLVPPPQALGLLIRQSAKDRDLTIKGTTNVCSTTFSSSPFKANIFGDIILTNDRQYANFKSVIAFGDFKALANAFKVLAL